MAEKKTFVLRLSPEMYESIERWAADEFRSVNGQIEFILNEALNKSGRNKAAKKKTEGDSKKS
jgi:hypothetical protein